MPTRYSHPPEDGAEGVALTDHLADVAERVRYVVPDTASTPAGEPLADVVETLAYVHDFGKATTYFQRYLLDSVDPDNVQCRYHAPIGAFAAYYALEARGYDTETCLAGFVAVGKHHGRVPDVTKYVFDRAYRRENLSSGTETTAERQQTAIAKQISDIDENATELAATVFDDATDGNGSWNEFRSGFLDLLSEIASAAGTSGRNPSFDRGSISESCYAIVLECWGSLVLADKTSAAQRSSGTAASAFEPARPSRERLDEYVEELEADVSADPNGTRTERLNHYRSRARETVIDAAESFAADGGGVATLTLPTGMGKTLSGLSAALTVRDRCDGDRVVYALPFTSIIDQVVDETSSIYETDTTGRLLTAHHHLSETTIRDGDRDADERDAAADEADLNDDVAGMLAESWRAGLTVTTFVQLFESLAGPTNGQSMKLPALRNSVVVLDEPQSLPLAWWKLVPRLVEVLTERYDATVIAMTATQPQLFEDATELVDDPKTYFQAAERVSYELDPSAERYISEQEGPKTYESATETLLESTASQESTLAVCNTINSAKTLTESVRDARPSLVSVGEMYATELEHVDGVDDVDPKAVAGRVEAAGDRSVLHLSTRLRPVDRLRLIETAKELTESEHSLLTVSTQLVEAGVDISFDRVYRDLAPIDSIVQAAGRCNRSFERERGTVTAWWLEEPADQQKTPAEAVYNRQVSLLPVAAETLAAVRTDDGRLPETAVSRSAVERYYERLHGKDVGENAYATYVDEARGDELESLSLIDQRLAVDVIVCRTDDDWEAVEAVREAINQYEFSTANERLEKLRDRQLSIPVYDSDSDEADALESLPEISDTGIRCLDTRSPQYDGFFDPETGFVVPDDTVERRFL